MESHQETLLHYRQNSLAYLAQGPGPLDQEACSQFLSRIPPGGRILDAGCGMGRDLLYFKQKGFEAEGIDACPELAEAARGLTGLPVQVKDLLFLSLPKERLDGIWCHRTLQHFNSEGCMRILAQFFYGLKPQGILFISIEEGSGSSQRSGPNLEAPPQTIFRYSEEDFASLIRQHGFQILAQGRSLEKSDPRIGFIAQRL